MAAVGRVDSRKLHPFLVVPSVGARQRNRKGNKDLSAKWSSLLCKVYITNVMKAICLNKVR